MANKTFRRVLSIIMCAAMLVSVFAVSFTASATVTTDDTEVTYDWDFTNADTAETDLAEMTEKSTYFNGANSTSFTCADGYLKVAGNSTNYESAVFENPVNYDLSNISVTAPYNAKVNNQVTQAGVVIGKTTYANGAVRIVKLSMSDMSYSNGFVRITDKNVGYDGNAFVTGLSLTLKTPDGADATKSYQKAFGVSVSDFSKLTYTYDVTAKDDNSVTVVVTITYDNAYTTTADPITINLATLQGYKDTITDFTPAFGVAKFFENQSNVADGGKLHKVTAVYKKGCEHSETETIAEVPATCTEPGVAEKTLCKNCGKLLNGGETIDALGHEWGDWETVTPATKDEEGLKQRICSRCNAVGQETLPPLDGSTIYNWNYADKNDGEAAYNATMEKVTFVNGGSKTNFTYNSDKYYLEATSTNQITGAVINTPLGSDGKALVPSKFSMTSPNNDDANRHYATAGAIIGYITLNEKQSPLYVNAASFNYGSADVSLLISNNVYSFDKRYYSEKLNLQKQDGTYSDDSYSDKHKYKTAFGFDISNDNLKYLTYTYDVTVEDDAATVTVTITYNNPSDGKEYTTVAKPITIDLEYINTLTTKETSGNSFASVTAFTPAFGIARVISGYNVTSKVYKVWAKYAKACDHLNTEDREAVEATCTKDGIEAGTYCTDCGKYISGGAVIPALGHEKVEIERVDATCKDGYVKYKCSRCEEEIIETLPATGEHVKGKIVEVVEANCIVDGYTLYECVNCGENFKADETLHDGKHTFDFSNGNYRVTKAPTETEDGAEEWYCTRCNTNPSGNSYKLTKIKIGLSATKVVLNGDINLAITVRANNYFTKNTLKLTITNKTTGEVMKYDTENGLVESDNDGYDIFYTVVITKFAHQMTDEYDVTFEGEVEKTTRGSVLFDTPQKFTSTTTGISVASYLEDIYKNEGEAYVPFHTIAAKLANYGAAAQRYYNSINGEKYTKFANDFLADDDANKATLDTAYTELANCKASGGFIKSGTTHFSNPFKVSLALSLQDNVKMVAKISGITLGANEKLYIKIGDEETVLEDNGNGVYTAVFGGFKPTEYAEDQTITLVVKNTSDNTEETSNAAKYSVGAYISRMAAKDTTSNDLKLLLNALTEYWQAAIALS